MGYENDFERKLNSQRIPEHKPNETTEIPPFLTGNDSGKAMSQPAEEDTVQLEAFEIQPEEIIEQPKPSHQKKRKAPRQKPEKLSGTVRILCAAVVAALAVYVVLNIYWSIFGTGAKVTAVSTPTPSSETEAPVASEAPAVNSNGSTMGTLTVDIDAITVRSEPSTSGTELGAVYGGETYSVYDQSTAEGYTWYKIDPSGQWIASDGTWVTYSGN